MRIKIIDSVGEFVTLCECKDFLRVNDQSRDSFIQLCAKTATTFVEKAINRSLIPHTIKLYTYLDSVHNLYLHDVDEIVSVTDDFTGEAVEYSTDVNKRFIILDCERSITVIYKTKIDEDIPEAKIAVLNIVSMLYDGITNQDDWATVIDKYLTHLLPK